jgi:hypothetical protein
VPQAAVSAVNALPRMPLSAGRPHRADLVSSRSTASSRSLMAAGPGAPAPHDPAAQVRLDHQPEAVEPFSVRGAAAEQGGLDPRSRCRWSGRTARARSVAMGMRNLGRMRQWAGSVYDTVKDQLGLERYGGRNPQGIFVGIAQRLSPWPPAFGERGRAAELVGQAAGSKVTRKPSVLRTP